MKKLLIKFAVASVASAASFGAFAACATASGSVTANVNGNKVEYAKPADGSTCYMQQKFDANVSSNVALEWVQNETAVAVAAASNKGRNNYSGSSEGGRVAQCGDPTTGSTAPTVTPPSLAKPNGCAR